MAVQLLQTDCCSGIPYLTLESCYNREKSREHRKPNLVSVKKSNVLMVTGRIKNTDRLLICSCVL